MRHRVFGRKLSKDRDERDSLFKGLVSSLIVHGKIKTTEARAKAVRGLVEKLVTQAKKKTVHTKGLVAMVVKDKKLVNKLVDEIAVKYIGRSGGFTRMTRIGKRVGDRSQMVLLEFVEVISSPVEEEKPVKQKEVKAK